MLLATMREKPRSRGERVDVDGVARAGNRAGAERQRVALRRAPPPAARDRACSGAACDRKKCATSTGCAGRKCVNDGISASPRRRRLSRQRVDDAGDGALQHRNPPPQIQPQIERHLLVARSAGVQAAAGVAEPLDQQPLDEAVDVFVGAVDERRARRGRARGCAASAVFDLARFVGATARPPRASARAHAMLPVTSSSNRRRSKRNEAPNSNAAASGAVSNRPTRALTFSPFVSGRSSSSLSVVAAASCSTISHVAVEQLQPDGAGDALLQRVDVGVRARARSRREPLAAIDDIRIGTADRPPCDSSTAPSSIEARRCAACSTIAAGVSSGCDGRRRRAPARACRGCRPGRPAASGRR